MRAIEAVAFALCTAAVGCHHDIRKVGAFPADRSGIEVSMQPSRLFAPQALVRVQQTLVKRDLLAEPNVNGHLDGPTRAALRKVQVAENLPQTGLLNYRTVRALGLDPANVFLNHEPAAD